MRVAVRSLVTALLPKVCPVIANALCAVALTLIAQTASAAPITFSAKGSVDTFFQYPAVYEEYLDDPPIFEELAVGDPWQLDVTFDANAIPSYTDGNVSIYDNILFARFQISDFDYATTTGGITAINYALPVGVPNFFGRGQVQFHFGGAWETGADQGPMARMPYFQLLILSWFDPLAEEGAFPLEPFGSPVLEWRTFTPSGEPGYKQAILWGGSSGFEPVAVSQVPEPTTFALLGTGAALLIWRRKCAKRSRSNHR
jgi:hypothetical protein